jgi:hypothetical protein
MAVPRPVDVIGVAVPTSPNRICAGSEFDESCSPDFLGSIAECRSVLAWPTITATATNATIDLSVLIVGVFPVTSNGKGLPQF